VTRLALGLLFLCPLIAADIDVDRLLKGVEERYNHARTLEVGFAETYSVNGRARKTEEGALYLRKPGRMRWEYTKPAGKLFVSDGKDVYFYTPTGNRAEKMALKETEDMRAPLAFLLGKLDFRKDFDHFAVGAGDGGTTITALPKSDKLPYRQVEFTVTPQFEIRKLNVTAQDGSVISYAFTNEKVNPPVNDKQFKFELPPGATFVNSGVNSGQGGGN
jgi:outer membrane lipoprotein carrier protein